MCKGVGGHFLIWPRRVCAAEQGVVFSILSRKQSMQFHNLACWTGCLFIKVWFRLAKQQLCTCITLFYILHCFAFYGGRELEMTTLFFFSWTSMQSFRIHSTPEKIAKIWRIERDGKSEIRFKATRLHFSVTFRNRRRRCLKGPYERRRRQERRKAIGIISKKTTLHVHHASV